MIKLNNGWDDLLKEEFEKSYYSDLIKFLEKEYQEKTIFPKKENLYNAFKYTSYDDVKVVILGQDPYHEIGQAHGLAFSVLENVKFPPSLKNIFKELNSDLNIDIPKNGDLTKWAKEGVLLLNSVLTVVSGKAGSHRNKGWEVLTDKVIELLNERKTPIVFILWGNFARSKKDLITNKNHLVLEAPHPSPLSAYQGFFGCNHFSKTNDFLLKNNQKPIDWSL